MATSKPPQILQLMPASEIVFEGPFKNVVTSDLELTNPSEKRICFKVKTTAPRRYCVRPNSGIVEPGRKIKIHIMLQPLDAEGLAEGHKHKFMVQSIVLNDGASNIESVWSQTDPKEIMDSKLRCIFHSSPAQAPADSPSNPFAAPAPSSISHTTTTTNASATPAASSASSANPELTTVEATTTTTITSTTANPPTRSAESNQSTSLQPQSVSNRETQQSVAAGREELHSRNLTQTTSFRATTSPAATISTDVQWNKSSSVAAGHLSSTDSLNKSLLSSHNSSSFLQPMAEDRRIVLVSLIMLVIGVIVGKFII